MRYLVLVGLLAAACAAPPAQPSNSGEPTAEELRAFCDVARATIDLSRQERMTDLLPVAPDQVRGSLKRASELQSTFEDDALIDELLDDCR